MTYGRMCHFDHHHHHHHHFASLWMDPRVFRNLHLACCGAGFERRMDDEESRRHLEEMMSRLAKEVRRPLYPLSHLQPRMTR